MSKIDATGRLERVGEALDRFAPNLDNVAMALERTVVIGDTLVGTFESMAAAMGVIPTWDQFFAGFEEFGAVWLPAIISGLSSMARIGARIAQYGTGGAEIGVRGLSLGSRIAVGALNPGVAIRRNGFDTWGDLLGGAGELFGDVARGIDPEGFESRYVDARFEALAQSRMNRARGGLRSRQALGGATGGLPFAALGINMRPGFNAGRIAEGLGMEAMMGITPRDRDFRTGFLRRMGEGSDPFTEFASDVGSVQRLRRGVGMLGIPAPMLSAEEGAEALKQAAEKLKKALDIPVQPLERFGRRMEDLDRLQASRNMNRGFNALLGFGGPDDDIALARLGAFRQQAADVMDRLRPPPLPTTRFAGSVEAMDLLNQAANDTKIWQLDVKAIFQEIARQQAEELKAAQEFVKELQKLNLNKIIVKPAQEKPG